MLGSSTPTCESPASPWAGPHLVGDALWPRKVLPTEGRSHSGSEVSAITLTTEGEVRREESVTDVRWRVGAHVRCRDVQGDNGGTGPTGPAGSAGSAGPAGPSF